MVSASRAGLPAARRHALRVLDRRRVAALGAGMLTTEGAVPAVRVRSAAWAASHERRARRRLLVALTVAARRSLPRAGSSDGGSTAGGATVRARRRPQSGDVPLGDVAGAAPSTLATQFPNPYANDPQAVQQGHDLFVKMNCAGCHGYGRQGRDGPEPHRRLLALRRRRRRRSSTRSIEGRPQGMPAWNPALPPQEIWKLVAYIQSLGGSYPAGEYQAWLQGDSMATTLPPRSRQALRPARPPARRSQGRYRQRAERRAASRHRPGTGNRQMKPVRSSCMCTVAALCATPLLAVAEPTMSYLHTFGPAGDPATVSAGAWLSSRSSSC